MQLLIQPEAEPAAAVQIRTRKKSP